MPRVSFSGLRDYFLKNTWIQKCVLYSFFQVILFSRIIFFFTRKNTYTYTHTHTIKFVLPTKKKSSKRNRNLETLMAGRHRGRCRNNFLNKPTHRCASLPQCRRPSPRVWLQHLAQYETAYPAYSSRVLLISWRTALPGFLCARMPPLVHLGFFGCSPWKTSLRNTQTGAAVG